MDLRQLADGTARMFSDTEGKDLWVTGGPSSPTTGTGWNARGKFTVKVPLNLTGQGTAALANMQNPFPFALIVGQTFLDITTSQATTLTISAGIGDTGASFDVNLISGFSCAGVAAGVLDNITDKGSNGKSRQKWGSSQFVTVSTDSTGSAASFKGNLYLDVFPA